MASSVPTSLVPGKSSQGFSVTAAEETTIPTIPTIATPQQTSLVSPTEQGWKITIRNTDGTSNEVTIEPKPKDDAGEDDDDEEKEILDKPPPRPSTKLRIYLAIQYTLNLILAFTILTVMILTLIKYIRTSSVPGAWPPTAILSPTILMLAVSMANIIIDIASLLVQCCGSRAISKMTIFVAKARNALGVLTAVAPAIAAGFSAFAKNTSGGQDLWGFSCSDAADAMAQVNSSDQICMTNTVAWALQIVQVIFQLLSVLIPLFVQMRPADEPDAKATVAGKGAAKKKEKEKVNVGDEEAIRLIDDNKAFAAAFASGFGSGK